jgi:hypothetical protein
MVGGLLSIPSRSETIQKAVRGRSNPRLARMQHPPHRPPQVIDTDQYEVVCVSPRNHFVFTPMLPSTAVGELGLRWISWPVGCEAVGCIKLVCRVVWGSVAAQPAPSTPSPNNQNLPPSARHRRVPLPAGADPQLKPLCHLL